MADGVRLGRALGRYWLVVVLCVLAGAGGGVAAALSQHTVYTATSTVIVNVPTDARVADILQAAEVSGLLTQSYAQVGTSRVVTNAVAAQTHLPAGTVRNDLTVTSDAKSLLLTITAKDRNSATAGAIASSTPAVLSTVISSLQTQADLKVDVQAIDVGVPPSKTTPKRRELAAVGLVLGAVVGFGAALLLAGRAAAAEAGAGGAWPTGGWPAEPAPAAVAPVYEAPVYEAPVYEEPVYAEPVDAVIYEEPAEAVIYEEPVEPAAPAPRRSRPSPLTAPKPAARTRATGALAEPVEPRPTTRRASTLRGESAPGEQPVIAPRPRKTTPRD